MSRFARLATGLRDFGNDINANISKALNISKVSDSPNDVLLEEARAGRVQGLEALLDDASCSAEVNGALDPSFLSPLCLACSGGHEDAALFLLRRAAADPNNAAGAHAAAAAAAAATVTTTASTSTSSPASTTFGDGGDRDACGGGGGGGESGGNDSGGTGAGGMPPTPLALAVQAGLERVVDELLARGARVDARRAEDGWTALHVCASLGNALVMGSLLTAAFADAGVRTSRLETPLSVASSCGHLSVVDLLLGESTDDAGNGGAGGGGGLVKGAALSVRGSALAATVEAGGSGGSGGGDGRRSGRGGRSPALPGCGKHAEEKTWAGRTPLHRAASRGHTEVVLRLLAHGVSANPSDSHGATPLILAARQGHWGAVRALVRGGRASARAATREGDTALHAAAWAGATVHSADRVVKLLVKSGAEVDATNNFGSTALHLAAAAGAHTSVLVLLGAGASPSATNSCGLSPGSCFLRTLSSMVPRVGVAVPGTSLAAGADFFEMRQALREHRERLGHVRRLADANAKRLVVAAVADRATASVHRFVEFALKTQRWDIDARIHRTRLQRLDRLRTEILSEPYNPAGAAAAIAATAATAAVSTDTNTSQRAGAAPLADSGDGGGSSNEAGQSNAQALALAPPPLLLDLSPEREGRASRAVKRREKAAAEAVRGARLALQDLEEWKGSVLAERQVVTAFLRGVDPTRALSAGAACDGDEQGEREGAASLEADVVIADQSYLSRERHSGRECESAGIVRRLTRSVSGTGVRSHDASAETSTSPPESESSSEGGRRNNGGFGHGGGRADRDRAGPAGFIRALAALNPCVGALREARVAGRSGDRLSAALETLREHVKATLIDLMDLETSIPGDGEDMNDEGGGNGIANGESGGGGNGSAKAESTLALTATDAGALDVKVVGLMRRLSGGDGGGGGGGDGGGAAGGGADVEGGDGSEADGPPSLATVYGDGLGGFATTSEMEVDTAESLTAVALQMVIKAATGPLLRALDDAYQRLIRADLDLRQLLPEAEALLGGVGSAKELALEARTRLVKIRQQVVDEEDLLEELVSKLRRRRRQAAGDEEIGLLEDERLSARARLASLRTAKLTELRALRRARAYERFPELLLEHPSRAESAFRELLLRGIAVRDVDEWQEHHMASVASMESRGDGSGGGGGRGFVGGVCGGSERVLDGLGGQQCWLAEIDDSAVAIVEVDCRDREAERALVATLLRVTPSTRRLFPELATISAVSLRDGRAMLEVPIEGALTAKAWLAATGVATGATAVRSSFSAGVSDDLVEPARETGLTATGVTRGRGDESKEGENEGGVDGNRSQLEVWVVMVQAMRGLAAVHAMSEGSTHNAVCLENILVAARPSPERSLAEEAGATVAAAAAGGGLTETVTAFGSTKFCTKLSKEAGDDQNTGGVSYSLERQASPPPRQPGFRRAQLGPPAPAALARSPTESVAPEVVRGQPFGQPADVYAFGVALRAACCGVKGVAVYYAPVDGAGASGGGAQALLPAGRGPDAGPLRQALLQLLGSMLEEDPSQRCTVSEALSSDYFRVPPLQPPGPIYPLQWSPFPVRTRRVSNTAPGSQPHWVAVALTAGRKDEGSEKGWLESCYAVDLPISACGASESGAGVKGEAGTAEKEGEAIQALLRRSLPGAHLLRLVRLQDRGRWLRFVCERDAATYSSSSSSLPSSAATAAVSAACGDGDKAAVKAAACSSRISVSRLFADPRDVVADEVLAAIAATTPPAGSGNTGGRTVGATDSPGEGGADGGARAAGVPQSRWAANAQVRCAETARYAAVALAPPLAKAGAGKSEGGGGGGGGEQWASGNVRTLAVVSAVTGGVSEERGGQAGGDGGGGGGGGGVLTKPAGAITTGGSFSDGQNDDDDDDDDKKDPFLGVDASVDCLTRTSGAGVPSSPLVDSSSGIGGLSPLAAVTGLSPPAVYSIKSWEAMDGYLGGRGGPGQDYRGGGAGADGATAVYALRRDACYPEYLVTFAL